MTKTETKFFASSKEAAFRVRKKKKKTLLGKSFLARPKRRRQVTKNFLLRKEWSLVELSKARHVCGNHDDRTTLEKGRKKF